MTPLWTQRKSAQAFFFFSCEKGWARVSDPFFSVSIIIITYVRQLIIILFQVTETARFESFSRQSQFSLMRGSFSFIYSVFFLIYSYPLQIRILLPCFIKMQKRNCYEKRNNNRPESQTSRQTTVLFLVAVAIGCCCYSNGFIPFYRRRQQQ